MTALRRIQGRILAAGMAKTGGLIRFSVGDDKYSSAML